MMLYDHSYPFTSFPQMDNRHAIEGHELAAGLTATKFGMSSQIILFYMLQQSTDFTIDLDFDRFR